MKVHKLRLINFRQYKDSTLDFSTGLIGIVGPNGSGKTSVLEAINFSLFGSRAIRGNLSDLKRKTAAKNEKIETQLIFEHEGKVFRIKRFLEKCELFQDGELEPFVVGTSAVSQKVEEILGMSFEEFANTYFTSQKALEFLSGKKGAVEREKFVLNMLGLEKVDRALDLLRKDKKDAKYKLQAYSNTEEALNVLKSELEQEKKVLKEASAEHKNQKVLYSEQDKALKSLKKEYNVSLKDKEKCDRFQNKINENKYKLEEIEKTLAKLNLEKKSFDKVFDEAEEGQLKKSEQDSLKKLANLEKKNSETKEVNTKLLKEKEFEISAKKNECIQIEKKLSEFNKLGGKSLCPTCNQELSKNFTALIKSNEKALNSHKKEISGLEDTYSAYLDKLKGQEEVENKLIINERKKIEDLRKRSQERAILSEKHKLFSKNFTMYSDSKLKIEKVLSETLTKQGDLNFKINEFNARQKKIETQAGLLQAVQIKKVRIEGEVETKRALIARVEAQILKRNEEKEIVKKINAELEFLEEGDKVLTKFRTYLNSSLRPRLAEIAGDFLAELTDGRYANIEIAKDFTPTVWEDGEPKAIISGGEEDILHLCVRLAMSQLLAERAGKTVSMLVLDEVFGSLDEIRRSNVISLFDRLRSRFEQIILVTHCEDIKDSVEHLIALEFDEATADLSISGLESIGLVEI